MVEPKLGRLAGILEEKGLDGAVIAHPPNIQYLTGIGVGGALLIASATGDAQLLVPPLEYHRALSLSKLRSLEIRPYYKYRLPGFDAPGIIRAGIYEALSMVVEELGLRRIGLDSAPLPSQHGEKIRKKLGSRVAGDLSRALLRTRSRKDPDEVEAMRRAARVAEEALGRAMEELREGMSELELAGIIEHYMRMHGAEEYAFPIIVAFSENAAYPHTEPSAKTLVKGAPILVDLGARINGYCSDMTRTRIHGEPSARLRRIYEAVLEALEEGVEAVRPGVKGSEVDAHARRILEKYGFSRYFIHGLGHGVGVEVHEYPRLSPGSEDVLEEGMVVTIEPGVYVPGLLGVRIEDMVLVGEKPRLLTSFPR